MGSKSLRRILILVLVAHTFGKLAAAVADDEPFLRIEADGPQSYITALAFDPTGTTLYSAGWDKVVHVWRRDPTSSAFHLDRHATLRLPIGPGLLGAVNAMAVSTSGRYLAVGGHGIFRGAAQFRQPGRVVPAEGILNAEMRQDEGLIHVFDLHESRSYALRGHAGSIVGLEFSADDPPLLISAAREWLERDARPGEYVGRVQLWRLPQGDQPAVAVAQQQLPEPGTRPGIAVRRTGAPPMQIEVGLAWGDERFRVWDVASGKVNEVACGKYGNTVDDSPSSESFLTGSFQTDGGRTSGQLELRRSLRSSATVSLRNDQQGFLVPRAMAVASGEGRDTVAIVSRVLPSTRMRSPVADPYLLQLVTATASGLTAAQGSAVLWPVPATGALPAVAISPLGDRVAVAGGDDQSIWLFSTQDQRLTARPVQVLRNTGSNWQRVSFVRSKDRVGLRLRRTSGDVVLDLIEAKMGSDTSGWTPNEPESSDWHLDGAVAEPKSIVPLLRANRQVSRVSLPELETIVTHAFLPRRPDQPRPALLALSSHQLGQGSLRLINAETGEIFRQLTGHTQIVTSLSFERDGRFLASVANDQTVSLWSLADVAETIGRHGMLPGVVVTQSEPSPGKIELSIAQLRGDTPAAIRSALRPGDRLLGMVRDGNPETWQTPREFFSALGSVPAGTEVLLKVRRGETSTDVPVKLGQAVDERKPLLSLFFPKPEGTKPEGAKADNAPFDWIAWSPLGPYETSRREAERYLGWHFNLENPLRLTRFAPAAEYREAYFRPGLIRYVTEHSRLPQPRVPEPTAMHLDFDSDAKDPSPGQATSDVVRLVRPPQQFRLYVSDLPPESIASIRVQIGEREFTEFQLAGEGEWTSTLPDFAWPRGQQRIRYSVRTAELPPQEFAYETSAELIPAPPIVRFGTPGNAVVETPMFAFEAEIESPSGRATETSLLVNGRKQPSGEWKEGKYRANVELQPGDNVLELTARNGDATEATADQESTRSLFRVTYRKAKALPPRIAIDAVEVFHVESKRWERMPELLPDRPLVVASPQVRITGHLRAGEAIRSADWNVGSVEPEERRPLPFQPTEDPAAWRFEQTVELQPGEQSLAIRARSADSDEAAASLSLSFRPPLPQIVWDASVTSGIVEREVHEPPAHVELKAELTSAESAFPFQTEVLVNDQPLPPASVQLDGRSLRATVALEPGENRVRIAVKNAWRGLTHSEVRVWQYRRLPRIVGATHTPVMREPFTQVIAQIETPPQTPPLHVTVGGQAIERRQIKQIESDEKIARWELRAEKVPLRPGANRLEVQVATVEGTARTPGVVEVQYDADFWKPPALDFPDTAPSQNVSSPTYVLRVVTRSASPLRGGRIEIDGVPVPKWEVAETRVGNQIHSELTATLTLRKGMNRVSVSVENEGGEARGERQISFVPPPVRVRVVSLEAEGSSTEVLHPEVQPDGQLRFPRPLASGFAKLHGVVEWHGAKPTGPSPPELRVWVNGFQQPPVTLATDSDTVSFAARIVIGEARQNLLNVELIGAPQDANSRVSLSVDCLKPQAAQRLHLLIVGADQQDAEAIKLRALKAVRAELDPQGQPVRPLRAAGFYRVNVYDPLVGTVTFSDVFRLLLRVKADLKIPLRQESTGKTLALNDVVMVYFEGGVLVPEKEHFVLSTSERFDANNRYSAIASDWLSKFFDSMRGAQLAFIDVSTDKPPRDIPVADWTHDSHSALLCYAWQRGFQPAEDMRLIHAMDVALGSGGRLGQVDVALAKHSAQSPELDYSRIVPERLESLILARPNSMNTESTQSTEK